MYGGVMAGGIAPPCSPLMLVFMWPSNRPVDLFNCDTLEVIYIILKSFHLGREF